MSSRQSVTAMATASIRLSITGTDRPQPCVSFRSAADSDCLIRVLALRTRPRLLTRHNAHTFLPGPLRRVPPGALVGIVCSAKEALETKITLCARSFNLAHYDERHGYPLGDGRIAQYTHTPYIIWRQCVYRQCTQ